MPKLISSILSAMVIVRKAISVERNVVWQRALRKGEIRRRVSITGGITTHWTGADGAWMSSTTWMLFADVSGPVNSGVRRSLIITNMKIIAQTGSHFDLDDEAAYSLINDVLSRPLFAHLATSSESGPRESPVWFLWEDDALWIIGNYQTDSFPKRIEQDPRCAIGIVDFDVSTGLVRHIGFRGRASLQSHDKERMKRLLSRYMGKLETWDSRFVEILADRDYIFIHFEPETVVVRDQSYQIKHLAE